MSKYYIFLIIAVVLIGVQFSITKLYQKKVGSSIIDAIIYTAISGFVSFIFFFCINKFSIKVNTYTVLMGALLAFFITLNNFLAIKITSMGQLSIYSMFLMLGGMLIPFFYGVLYLNEKLHLMQIIGLVFMFIALILQLFNGTTKKKTGFILYALCLLIFISNGFVGVITKAHQVSLKASGTFDFLCISYIFLFLFNILALIPVIIIQKKKNILKCYKVQTTRNCIIISSAYSIVSAVAFMLQVMSASKLYASVQYPIVTGGSIVLSAIFGWIIFKEKPGKTIFVGIVVAFIATLMFMF